MDVRLFARTIAVGGAVTCAAGVVLDAFNFVVLGGALALVGIFTDHLSGRRKR